MANPINDGWVDVPIGTPVPAENDWVDVPQTSTPTRPPYGFAPGKELDPEGFGTREPIEANPLAAVAEIPKAIAAGTERALGTIGTTLQYKGDQMQDPAHRLLMKAAPGPALVQFIADKLALPKKLQETGKYISEYWDEQASKGWEAPDPELMEAKWNRPLQYGARVTFESAPSFAVAIGAGYVTGNPNIALTLMGAFEKLNSYAKQREGGASYQKANIISSLSGAWEAVTEKIPFDYMLKGGVGSRLVKAVTAGGLEGLQELLAGMGQNFLEYFGY